MTAAAAAFTGFGSDLVELFSELEAHNDRGWWQANKGRYAEVVGEPMRALAADLEPRFGAVKLFRPHRDVRFSPDKRPLQEHAALAAAPDGPVLYLQVSADGLLLAGGWYQPARAALEAWRALLDDPRAVAGLRRHLAGLAGDGFALAEPSLVRAPRGVRTDHPAIDLLRVTQLTVGRTDEPGPWLATRACLDRVVAGWEVCMRWNRWLATHLGGAGGGGGPAPA